MPEYSQYDVPGPSEMVNFGVGQPSTRELPLELLQLGAKKMSEEKNPELLQYGYISGYPRFRKKLASFLQHEYQTPVNSDNLLITGGVTQGLSLICSIFCKSGDYILAEEPSYFLALNIFRDFGLKVIPVKIEQDGISITDLEAKIKNIPTTQHHLFLYSIPTFHNPTGYTMSEVKRNKLVGLCNKFDNFYVLADEVYQMLYFDTKPPLPLFYYHEKMISLGTFSKILAPAYRLGWIQAQGNIYKQIFNCGTLDSSGGVNPIGSYLVEPLLENNILSNYIITVRNQLKERCSTLVKYLQPHNDKIIKFIPPTGGYFLWIDILKQDSIELLEKAIENKVKFHSGNKFSAVDKLRNFIRLSFSYYQPDGMEVGVKRLVDTLFQNRVNNRPNICVLGGNGRLGNLICKELQNSRSYNFNGIIDRNIHIPNNTNLIIDVSSPVGTNTLITKLINQNIYLPVIIGTTGNLPIKLIKQYSTKAPVHISSNFSEGVPFINKISDMANSLSDKFDFKIEETHHVHKKDAPSGTAKTLKSYLKRECGIESFRKGEVFGEHDLIMESQHEIIKVSHKAKTRSVFASGCVRLIDTVLSHDYGLFGINESCTDYYYSGSGNNLMVLEYERYNDKKEFVVNHCNLVKELDGVIFYKNINQNMFYWEYYNRDGSNVEFCGNGSRCLGKHIINQHNLNEIILVNNFKIITNIYKENENIWAQMPQPILFDDYNFNKLKEHYDFISEHIHNSIGILEINKIVIGVPHLVIRFKNKNEFENINLENLGNSINSKLEKINVNICYYENNSNIIYNRTWERGVNRETMSCGSGSTAVAYNYYINHLQNNTSLIKVKFSDNEIFVKNKNNNFYLSGNIEKQYCNSF